MIDPLPPRQGRSWTGVLLGAGVLFFLVGALARLPAEVLAGSARHPVGTVWRGEAVMGDSFALAWTARPFTSVLALAPTARIHLRGPDTALSGDAVWFGPHRSRLDIQGVAQISLLQPVWPHALPACDGTMQVKLENLYPEGGGVGRGRVQLSGADCQGMAGATRLPPTTISLNSDRAALSGAVDVEGVGRIATLSRSADQELILSPTPVGAAFLPALSTTVR